MTIATSNENDVSAIIKKIDPKNKIRFERHAIKAPKVVHKVILKEKIKRLDLIGLKHPIKHSSAFEQRKGIFSSFLYFATVLRATAIPSFARVETIKSSLIGTLGSSCSISFFILNLWKLQK